MCGLCFVMRKDGRCAVKQLMKSYERQKSRGQQGFGYVAFRNGEIDDVSRNATEKGIYTSLKSLESEGVMFHHRFPTSTPNFKEGAHPIHVSNKRLKYDYYVIHNGVISNDDFLKKKHEALGYKYTTEMIKKEVWTTRDEEYVETTSVSKYNDSEALAIELAEAIESNAEKVEAYGSIAFICLQADKDDGNNVIKIHNIFYGRNTNPLMIDDNSNYFKLSSENGRVEATPHTLYAYDMKSKKTTKRDCTFGSSYIYQREESKKHKWIDGHMEGVKWIEGHYEEPKLPIIYTGRDDYDDEAYWSKRQIEIERNLEMELEAGKVSKFQLTGEETLKELENMLAFYEDLYEESYKSGDENYMTEVWDTMVTIEEAIDEWHELNNSVNKMLDDQQVKNPPKYNKDKDNGKDKK